ncbi:MAG TPA: hypothetical protein PLJ60_15130 [Chryseolinea sp.]|nr:hypothetical protein [Chryseolinea sp.]HPH45854.1 hypothetical protein [Chryseolinea sp.]HPM31666.1 hypothetical protein [Chryseolinea sp.]
MTKRALTFTILLSMVLHCAGRLGVLSYLYKNRLELANTIGIISEIPIALCSSDYDADKNLKIHLPDSDTSLPVNFLSGQEIILFFNHQPLLFTLNKTAFASDSKSHYALPRYPSPTLKIFQPPRIS